MSSPNECGVTMILHLRGAGPLGIDVLELTSPGDNMVERYSVSIGAGVHMQEVILFLDPGQLVQLSAALETWARSIQAKDLPSPLAAAVDPQQGDDLVDVRGDK